MGKKKNLSTTLSNGQIKRMGGLIAIFCGRCPYGSILADLEESNLAYRDGQDVNLTMNGETELRRLLTISGLMIGYRNGEPDIQATNAQRSPESTGRTL